MNPILIALGEKIHDAMRMFALVCNKKEWVHSNLEGGCAPAAYFLTKAAHKHGIDATFMAGSGHCWCESDGFIYDPTATQFTIPVIRTMWDMDRAEKVRVVSIADVPYLEPGKLAAIEDYMSLPQKKWGSNRYCYRLHHFSTTEENLIHINSNWPQGQRVFGYRIEWNNDIPVIYWKGKNVLIGRENACSQ